MGTLATKLVLLRPRDPESKGIVERRNGYFETSFLPGRTFSCPADFNVQLADWLVLTNARRVRTTRAAPVDRLTDDLAAMRALPPQPLHLGHHARIRLPRDYYVRLDGSDYSVDPRAIGRLVDVHADLTHVRVRARGELLAEHPRQFARGMTITDPDHVTTARTLRSAFLAPTTASSDDDLVRDLADYDHAFGLGDMA